MSACSKITDLGVGVGLRTRHYGAVLEPPSSEGPALPGFLELIADNYLSPGGRPRAVLAELVGRYPLVLHAVSLGLGGPDEPSRELLAAMKRLVREVKPELFSDHFCWTAASGRHLHDLLPLPYTEEVLRRLVRRARMVQDYLEVPFALENTSSYFSFSSSAMPEWEFVSRAAEEADIGILFDVNNVYVSAYNHGIEALEFVRGVPPGRILQVHLAGHTHHGTHIIDTHIGPPIPEVLDLYRETLLRTGPVSTLLEWDEEVPPWGTLLAEAERIATFRARVLGAESAGARAAIASSSHSEVGS